MDDASNLKDSSEKIIQRIKPGSMLLLWGWLLTLSYLIQYFTLDSELTDPIKTLLHYLTFVMPFFGLLISMLYLGKNKDKPSFSDNMKVVWIWLIVIACMSLTNMIIWRVNKEINFELQHPIFMVFTAAGIIITGILKKYQWVIFGGLSFGILAYMAAVFPIKTQMLFEAIGWFIAFVIPGHQIFARPK
jgi:hypothetical protein